MINPSNTNYADGLSKALSIITDLVDECKKTSDYKGGLALMSAYDLIQGELSKVSKNTLL